MRVSVKLRHSAIGIAAASFPWSGSGTERYSGEPGAQPLQAVGWAARLPKKKFCLLGAVSGYPLLLLTAGGLCQTWASACVCGVAATIRASDAGTKKPAITAGFIRFIVGLLCFRSLSSRYSISRYLFFVLIAGTCASFHCISRHLHGSYYRIVRMHKGVRFCLDITYIKLVTNT